MSRADVLVDAEWVGKRLDDPQIQPDVKNYDGSRVEYGSLVGVPIEK